ncbi:MAG: hypothetical protein HC767_08490 [Akkermansiaceae bacterium]|nr:hypothetical protein [Akkermansiaceae bacterium]
MRDWPMFQARAGKTKRTSEGRPFPRISDLIMSHVAGTPSEKLAWLHEQRAAGTLDGDDPEEIAQAEALLVMLVRLAGSRTKHLDELVETKSAQHVRARRYG